jgi:hypothetical protein
MLSSSNFRIRASAELAEIRDEILDLATDRDVYWKVQREVIQQNPRLLNARNAFFDMMNDSYAHATASRIRRLIDRDYRVISLRRLIEALGDYPDLLSGKMSTENRKDDLATLDRTCEKVKGYVDQFVAHHERNSADQRLACGRYPSLMRPAYQRETEICRAMADADIAAITGWIFSE